MSFNEVCEWAERRYRKAHWASVAYKVNLMMRGM